MKIVTYDELTERQKVGALCLSTMAFGGSWDIKSIELIRREGDFSSDYFAMYAVEGDLPLGQVVVHRFDYVFPDGTVRKVSGLAGVTTRADKSKRGVARGIIEAVHARELEAGIGHSLLWTVSSWHAHDLYLRLGYRDILTQPLACRTMDRKRKVPQGFSIVRAKKHDIPSISEMGRVSSAGSKGFAQRPSKQLSVWVETGNVDIGNIFIVKKGTEPAGLFYREKEGSTVRCREMVALPGFDTGDIVEAVESHAAGGAVVMFRDVLTQSTVPFFRERGYDIYPSQWKVLMGTKFGNNLTEQQAVDEFGTSRDDFICQGGDGF